MDTVEELEKAGENALLKVLEEPPPRSLLLLVTHAPGRVIPTIRSRCRLLMLRPLPAREVARAAAAVLGQDADDADIRAAAEAADGSVARALMFLDGPALELRQRIIGLLDGLPQLDQRALHSLGDKLGGTDAAPLAAFMDTVNSWLSAQLAGGAARQPPHGAARRGLGQGQPRRPRDRRVQSRPPAVRVLGVRRACRGGAVPLIPSPMAEKPRYYITTAISYPNGPPHIGHAYEVIATDAIARFKRLDGYDVFFLTGTDEHGQKIQQTATKEGITARELVDRNVPRFRAMVERLNCSNDDFIRTTEERHHRSSQAIWQRMEKNGDIYLDKYAGWYSVRDEAYYAENETHLNEHKVRLASKTGTPVEWVEEESYFFKLSAYQQKLLDLYASIPTTCCRRSVSTKWRASCAAACRTCRSRAPRSTGASACPATTSTSCTSGSTR